MMQTKQQIARLNRIFEVLNEKPTGESCQGMKGLLKEGKEFASADGDPGTVDVGIINALHLRHAASQSQPFSPVVKQPFRHYAILTRYFLRN